MPWPFERKHVRFVKRVWGSFLHFPQNFSVLTRVHYMTHDRTWLFRGPPTIFWPFTAILGLNTGNSRFKLRPHKTMPENGLEVPTHGLWSKTRQVKPTKSKGPTPRTTDMQPTKSKQAAKNSWDLMRCHHTDPRGCRKNVRSFHKTFLGGCE